VRLGLCLVKGLRQAAVQQLLQARGTQLFQSLEELARRSALSAADLKLLAAAGALAELTADRNQAWWAVAGLPPPNVNVADPAIRAKTARLSQAKEQVQVRSQGELDFHAPLPTVSPQESPAALASPPVLPALPVPDEGSNIVADYAHLGLTLGRHPLALLRPRLMRWRYRDAGSLRSLPNGRTLQVCGIVTGRQRPDTASGVVFVTLEDESGSINVVVWRELAERQRRALLGSSLLAVAGVLQREGDVIHLLARQLTDRSAWLGRLQTASRDFH
jgi:error-prone DNA polymerase